MHEHHFSADWSSDGDSHWHACESCDERAEEAKHSFEWTETVKATRSAPGEEEGVCTVCGYTTTREVPYTGSNILQRVPIQIVVIAILVLILFLVGLQSANSGKKKSRH